jgi:hypothetical protein
VERRSTRDQAERELSMAVNPAERGTPFPTSPSDVVALTVPEFTNELELNESASLDAVCRRFEDTNRAVVWFIRFRALTAWRDRVDVAMWLRSEPSHARCASQLAASFELNDAWEFDADRFRSAVESVAR